MFFSCDATGIGRTVVFDPPELVSTRVVVSKLAKFKDLSI